MPPCVRCPKVLGRSCCEPGPDDRLATITRADVERIAAHTGRSERFFVREEWLTQDEVLDYPLRRPNYAGYFDAAPVRLTLQTRDGRCVFHSREQGCALTAEARPLACRLYPFESWPDGTIALVPERHGDLERARADGAACLAVEEAEDFEVLLDAFGTSEEQVRALAAQLRNDVHAHARASARGASRRQALGKDP